MSYFFLLSKISQQRKTTTIRRTAVGRLTCLSIMGTYLGEHPPETSRTSQHYGIQGLKGGIQLSSHYTEKRKALAHREIFSKSR